MRRYRMLALAFPLAVIVDLLPEQPAAGVQKKDWYVKAVKKIEGKFEPAEAKPGQTVVFKLIVDLNDGYHTYPTVQPDKAADNFVNVLKFPSSKSVIFVGSVTDPKDYDTKAEPELKIKELRINSGTVVYTRKAVVSPKASAGMAEVKLDKFQLMVCDEKTCYPGREVPVTATIKVLDAPAVPVDKEYAEEVAKATK